MWLHKNVALRIFSLRSSGAYLVGALIFASTVLLSACATDGPTFSTLEAPGNEAIVYFYRPTRIYGAAGAWILGVNGLPITRLKNGGYYPYKTRAGKLEISLMEPLISVKVDQSFYDKAIAEHISKGKQLPLGSAPVAFRQIPGAFRTLPMGTLEAEAGESYFYRYELGTFKSRLTPVSKSTAMREITNCKLLSDSH